MQLFQLLQEFRTEAFSNVATQQGDFYFIHGTELLGVFANPRRLQNKRQTCECFMLDYIVDRLES